MLLNTILTALLPLIVTFLFGFVASWRHDFGSNDATTLNRMVLLYAVPLALFGGTVATSRLALIQGLPLLGALCVAVIGLYAVVFMSCRIVLRLQVSVSALAALTASAPSVPFVGPAILGDLFGVTSAIPIAMASLVINLTVVPITILFLALGTAERKSAPQASRLSVITAKLGDTVKEPIVWAPILAFVVVLSGLHIPTFIVHSLSLLGVASAGVALFASGIVLATNKLKLNWYVLSLVLLKNVIQPAALLGGLRWFGYGSHIVSEAVLTTAIPTVPIVIILALRYRVAQAETASAVFFSVIGSIITIGFFIALTQ
jgi:predicted permease